MVKRNIQFFLLFFCLFATEVSAETMRKCMLLPISDSVGGAVAFKVFEHVETYLKESDWCYYKSNSEVINILGHYKNNLDEHLRNKEIIKLISEKTKSGSIIKIDITSKSNGVSVVIEILGENGEDLYFKEKTQLDTQESIIIAQTIKNWLDVYEKTIPYEGTILGVLGNQFTVDIGRQFGLYPGSEVSIIRPKLKRRHPLLKEIVDFETELIGKGKIFHVTTSQGQGKIVQYESKKRLRVGDWVISTKSKSISTKAEVKFKEAKEYQFGKIGKLGLFINIGKGNETVLSDPTTTRKFGGMQFGVDLLAEVWATRKYWIGIEFDRKFGSYKLQEGTASSETNSLSAGVFRFKMGYKYLPLGFFYGPQIDGFIGYAKYSYSLDTQLADGITGSSFKGLLLGTKAGMPIMKSIRIFMELDFTLKGKYSEDVVLYGNADSVSSYHLQFGGNYGYSPSMAIEGSLGVSTNKANFKSPTRQVSFRDTSVKLGTTYTF